MFGKYHNHYLIYPKSLVFWFKVPQATNKAADSSCTLTVTENGLTATELFSYSLALTPKLTSVSPSRGGTGGGTVLTISGQNFPTDPTQVVVKLVIFFLMYIN